MSRKILLTIVFITFIIIVKAQFSTTPDKTVNFKADEAYNLVKGKAKYHVWFGCGQNKIDKPLIIIEGYDPTNARGAKQLYFNIIDEDLALELRQEGFDIIGFDPDKGATAIQRNGLAFAKLIEIINDKLDRNSINHD